MMNDTVCASPLVSVIMSSYNYSLYISDAIESVLSQTLNDFELIIVDDGSTDDSWHIIQKYAKSDDRIIAVRQSNQGPSAATNRALSLASGKYIASFTSDDRCLPSRLERQIGFLEINPNYDIVGSYIEAIDSVGTVKSLDPYSEWFNRSVDINDPGSWIWKNLLASPTVTFRKSFFLTYGNFDPELVYTQDWDMWIRALSLGCKIYIIQEPLVQYRSHGNNLTHGDPLEKYLEYAYITSKSLNPWLSELGRHDLICENALIFFENNAYSEVESFKVLALFQMMFTGFGGSYGEYICTLNSLSHVFSERRSMFSLNTNLLENFYRGQILKQKKLEFVRDSALSERDNALSERDNALSERDNALSERDALQLELYMVYQSKSWHLTRPLRFLVSRFNSIKNTPLQIYKAFFNAINVRRISSGLRFIIRGDLAGFQSAVQNLVRASKKSFYKRIPEHISSHPLENGLPLVSVIIPCFNYGKFVTSAIDSALSQTLSNVEVIVIDGGSTDAGTIRTLQAIQRPRTRVVFREGRHFVGDNRNYGIGLARGRYICCLDADDTLDPTYLEKAAFYLETYGYDVVSTSIKFFGARSGCIDTMEYPDLRDMAEANHVLTCAVFRKNLWESVGGYVDVGIGKHHVAEDWDFWLKLSAHGARIRNISREHLFNYRIHEGGSLSSSSGVKPLSKQKKFILNANRSLLTPNAFRYSEDQQARYLRCEPSQTALSWSFKATPHGMTLLLVMPYFLIGGAERLLSGLCQYLVTQGWRVVVISTLDQEASHGTSIDWFKFSTSEVYSLPLFLDLDERADFIAYLIASRRVDCVLNTGSRLLYELLPTLKQANPNLCIVDFLFNKIGHVESHLKYKEFISCALAENNEVLDWYLQVAGWSSTRVAMVQSGVDLERHKPTPRPEVLVKKYHIDPDELVVGFSGRFSEEKAPDIFLEVASLCRHCIGLRFVMTGGGPLAKSIEEKAKGLPAGTRFELAGLVDDVSEYLALYDLLVLPSYIDGRPLVVMEAMACGVPIIASSVGGLPSLISNGKNGFLVPPANAQAIADRILELAEDRLLLAELKEGARTMAEEKLDANSAYGAFESTLAKAVSAHKDLVSQKS